MSRVMTHDVSEAFAEVEAIERAAREWVASDHGVLGEASGDLMERIARETQERLDAQRLK